VIREDEAAQALGILVGGTQGWNDEAVAIYLQQLVNVNDPDALLRTCQHILTVHTDPGRPSLARILDRYRYEETQNQRRKPPAPPEMKQLGAHTRAIPPLEGIEIARAAYQDECARQGRQPNHQIFDTWARRIASNC
jgi:hypothetical protein